MAAHYESGSSDKKPSDGVDDLLTFNAENMQSNMKIIYYRFVLTADIFSTLLMTSIWLGALYLGWTLVLLFVSFSIG